MDTAGVESSVTLSEAAARRIAEILRAEGNPELKLRIAVSGGGCAGFQYGFSFDDVQAADDVVLGRDGAVVLIDPVSVEYMRGAEIDFVEDLVGRSFKISNPKATSKCGCGTSFSV